MSNATTGSDRVVPGQQPPEPRDSRLARFTRPAVTHWQFAIVLAAAIVVRIIVILGYPPILWFNDSYNYLYDAVTSYPGSRSGRTATRSSSICCCPCTTPIRWPCCKRPWGSAWASSSTRLLRHRGLPWWGAALPTLPVLFDSYELHLEHMVTADTLFIFLGTAAVVILCWSDRPSVPAMAVAGLLIGYATLVRSVGQPLLVVVLVAMLARRVGWRRLVTVLVAGIVPIAAYMVWFHGTYGNYALTGSSGTFLYGRVSTFAECATIKPPADLQVLCDPTPPYLRPVSGEYIWADNELGPDWYKTTPLYKATGNSSDTSLRFTPSINSTAEKFAKAAILAQPVDYLRVVAHDTLHTFGWNRQPDPNNDYGNGPAFTFVSGQALTNLIPWWAGPQDAADYAAWTARYPDDPAALQMYAARQDLGGPGLGNASAVQPWQRLLQIYQRYFYLRGALLGLIVLIGAAGVLARWRRWGGVGLLPWLVGALLIVLPPMTAGFSYRYVLAAVPAVCLAAGLAFVPGGKSVRALAADLRRHLGRGVAVEQE